jgi:hypothetical protein
MKNFDHLLVEHPRPSLASERYAELEQLGVSGSAAAIVVRQTSAERHQWRTALVIRQAILAAKTHQVPEPVADWDVAHAWLLLAMDAAGVGGTGDYCGRATARVPGLDILPRKRQMAGGAWCAAVSAAIARLEEELGSAQLFVQPVIDTDEGEGLPAIDLQICAPPSEGRSFSEDIGVIRLKYHPELARWARALAVRAVFDCLQVSREHLPSDLTSLQELGVTMRVDRRDCGGWARIINAIDGQPALGWVPPQGEPDLVVLT